MLIETCLSSQSQDPMLILMCYFPNSVVEISFVFLVTRISCFQNFAATVYYAAQMTPGGAWATLCLHLIERFLELVQ